MIPAAKSPAFNRWFSRHAEQRIRAHFSAVRLAGRHHLADALATGPVLVVSNHCSWWDPLWLLALSNRIVVADAYAMMDAKNLERLPFFAKVGAFGVDRARPDDGARSVRYAARLLDAPGKVLFVFPQGEERASTLRPLGFLGGSAAIARVARRAAVVPMAVRYEHGGEPRPVLYASLGVPLARHEDVEAGRGAQEAAVTAELERIDTLLVRGEGAFETLWTTPPSVWERWAERALAWWTRGAIAARE